MGKERARERKREGRKKKGNWKLGKKAMVFFKIIEKQLEWIIQFKIVKKTILLHVFFLLKTLNKYNS